MGTGITTTGTGSSTRTTGTTNVASAISRGPAIGLSRGTSGQTLNSGTVTGGISGSGGGGGGWVSSIHQHQGDENGEDDLLVHFYFLWKSD